MRALVQKVTRATVRVEGESVGEIGAGLCVFIGVAHGDTEASAAKLASKVWNLRVLEGDARPMERSVAEAGGAVVVVSQFTLYGDTSRGRRPSWVEAASPSAAEPLVEAFCSDLRDLGAVVESGRFGAHMEVELVNDGPVTLMLEA